MNRSYPGDETSDRHEERLASDLRAELAGTTALSIHSTRSYADPFGATAGLTDADRRVFERLGLEYAVDVGGVSDRHLAQLPNYVEIEAGLQGTDAAARNAYDLTRRFLRATGVVPGTPERRDTSYVTIYETVPKRADATYSITARNFRAVEPDEEFARRDGTPIRATEAFVPVLMSSTGYEDILGFKSAVVD
jgi:predicted deacylase